MQDDFRSLIVEAASPEALRRNPFRLLGLPTDASTPVLRRETERRRMVQRLSGDEEGADGGGGADGFEDALRRLRDPAERLVDELLWYWPDDVVGADDHNAAIEALHGFADAGADASDQAAAAAHGHVVDQMARSLADPATVAHLATRAEALDDPRIAAADAAHLVDAAKMLAPLLALRLAVRLHRAGDVVAAARLAGAARSGAGRAADEAAALVLAPVFESVRNSVEGAVGDVERDRSLATESAQRLLERTRSDRMLLEIVLGETDPQRSGIVDQVAEVVHRCALIAFEGDRDVGAALQLLRAAAEIHPAPATRDRLDEAMAVLEEHLRAGLVAGRPAFGPGQMQQLAASYRDQLATADLTDVMVERCAALAIDYGLLVLLARLPISWLWIAAFVLNSIVLQGLSGRTVGKTVALGIRTVGPDGRSPGIPRAAVRSLPWVAASLLGLVLPMGAGAYFLVFAAEGAVAAITTGRRRIGDLLAGTFVVLQVGYGAPVVPKPRRSRMGARVVWAAVILGVGAGLSGWGGDDGEGDDDDQAARTAPSGTVLTTTSAPVATTAPPPPPPPTTTTTLRPPVAGECARPDPRPTDPNRYAQVACDDPSATVLLIETHPGYAIVNTCAAGTDIVLEYQVTEYFNGVPIPQVPETWCMRNL